MSIEKEIKKVIQEIDELLLTIDNFDLNEKIQKILRKAMAQRGINFGELDTEEIFKNTHSKYKKFLKERKNSLLRTKRNLELMKITK